MFLRCLLHWRFLVYPRMISVHDLASKETDQSILPFSIPLSSEHIINEGIYLLENGIDALLYVGSGAKPLILKQIFGTETVDDVPHQFDNPLSKRLNEVIDAFRKHRCSYLRLAHRINTHSDLCPCCGKAPETDVHVLRDCIHSRAVWDLLSMEMDFQTSEGVDWILGRTLKLNVEDFSLFLIVLWSLWNRRNAFVFEGRFKTEHVWLRNAYRWLQNLVAQRRSLNKLGRM